MVLVSISLMCPSTLSLAYRNWDSRIDAGRGTVSDIHWVRLALMWDSTVDGACQRRGTDNPRVYIPAHLSHPPAYTGPEDRPLVQDLEADVGTATTGSHSRIL